MKRTIEEVVTLYELEPATRRDLYVEGETDRELIGWFFERSGVKGRAIYPIDLVDVPASLVASYGLNTGSNRSRVIALAHEVWKEVPRERCGLVFVVDRDLSHFIENEVPPEGVLVTDYAAMDAYLLQNESLNRFARFICKIDAEHVHDFIGSVFSIAHILFALRLSLVRTGLAIRIVGTERVLRATHIQLDVDKHELVRRTLSAGSRLDRLEEVLAALEVALNDLAGAADRRYFVNGHDVMLILAEGANKFGRDSSYRQEVRVRRALLMAVVHDEIAAEGFFQALLAA